MSDTAASTRGLARLVEGGLLLRLLAADAVQRLASRRGTRCLFPDTDIYWRLGQALRRGGPFEVSQWGVPHRALRTPGYPLFLAGCQAVFGDRTLPARLAQAVLGAGCVLLVYALVARLTRQARPARFAAALMALEPGTIGLSALLLSEAVFLPLMLLGLWGLAALWSEGCPRGAAWVALGTGAAWGAAILIKPSWALFPPGVLLVWLIAAWRRSAFVGAPLVALGLVTIMAPWWIRNAQIYGRFAPTALWMGASLYDGLNPGATGASDMRFLGAPDVRLLSEEAQDAVLTARALAFARSHPGRVARLAGAKAARYWSPWPVGTAVRSPVVKALMAAATLPIYVLILAGIWDRRRDARALALLAGPVFYFAAIHIIFVSSIRYRLPGMVPAFGLAACGMQKAAGRT